jgi:hypothetical protein
LDLKDRFLSHLALTVESTYLKIEGSQPITRVGAFGTSNAFQNVAIRIVPSTVVGELVLPLNLFVDLVLNKVKHLGLAAVPFKADEKSGTRLDSFMQCASHHSSLGSSLSLIGSFPCGRYAKWTRSFGRRTPALFTQRMG